MPKGIPNPKEPATPEDIATRLKCLEYAAKIGTTAEEVTHFAAAYERWVTRNVG